MTVLEVIQRSADFLAKKGVESPRLQVELLLAHVLKLPRMGLYLNFERALTPSETDQVRELVRRRGQREPLQHIVGSTSFCGLELSVNDSVLVPRPETEQLAELGWEFLNAESSALLAIADERGQAASSPKPLSQPSSPPLSISDSPQALHESPPDWPSPAPTALDFGTGSGCLAIALAVKVPEAQIVALDISEPALAVARENAVRHQVADRIRFLSSDGFAAVPAEMRFDLIVANPPYIPSAEIATLDPEVRDHDPGLALNGGAQGLDFYERLAREAGAALRSGGRIMVEFGDGQAEAVRGIFERQNWIVEQVKPDYSGRLRFLLARPAQ